jgi:hypothetical protein
LEEAEARFQGLLKEKKRKGLAFERAKSQYLRASRDRRDLEDRLRDVTRELRGVVMSLVEIARALGVSSQAEAVGEIHRLRGASLLTEVADKQGWTRGREKLKDYLELALDGHAAAPAFKWDAHLELEREWKRDG